MKKLTTLLACAISAVMLFGMTACTEETPTPSGDSSTADQKVEQTVVDLSNVNGDGSTVKMSVLYDDMKTRMRFVSGSRAPYESKVDGVYYKLGDPKRRHPFPVHSRCFRQTNSTT